MGALVFLYGIDRTGHLNNPPETKNKTRASAHRAYGHPAFWQPPGH